MIEHLVACTLAAGAALAAVWALSLGSGRCPARWRYALLLAALLRFALPTGWLDAMGKSMAPLLPAPARTPQAVEDLRRLLLHPGIGPATAAPALSSQSHPAEFSILLLLLTAGAAACVYLWARRCSVPLPSVRPPALEEREAFLRACRMLGITRAVELRIVTAEKVPGALGYWRPAVVLPEGLAAQLSGPELEAVLAHELAHILRHDNLWAALAHALVALFWFHPLVWWIERRMLKEREIACDELVLDRGTHPEVYLSGILKVCRMAFGGAAGYAGANGSSLKSRMERIMSPNVPRPSHLRRAASVALVAIAAFCPLAGGYLNAQPQQTAGDPAQSRNLFEQGSELMAQRDYAGAERAFRRSYDLDPENVRGLMGIVEAQFAQGRQNEALALLAQEAARRPDRLDLQMALANADVRAGRYDQAISEYQKLLDSLAKNSRESGDLYLRIGEVYRRMRNYPQAIAALRQSVELQPKAPVPLSTLALVLDASGKTQDAEQTYRKVLQVDPNNGVARNNLAFLLAAHGGNLDEALDLAKDAQLFLPQVAETSDTLGFVYLTRKESDRAVAEFRTAVLQEPTNAAYRNHLVQAIEQKGDRSSNAEALKRALAEEATPANQELVKKLLQ